MVAVKRSKAKGQVSAMTALLQKPLSKARPRPATNPAMRRQLFDWLGAIWKFAASRMWQPARETVIAPKPQASAAASAEAKFTRQAMFENGMSLLIINPYIDQSVWQVCTVA